ncbi:MAG: hypothetical protein CL581_06080 [Alteromonadaceae bacterium]|nr:hypothetical protein [Alteromonadaceae bacterium]MBH84356.1 hypothetical protein [Alteromonadaceae bacterium]
MTTERYRIQFEGRVLQGFSPDLVKQNLQALFRLSPDRIETLFDGSLRTIKSDLSFDDANAYRDRLMKAGADARVTPVAAPKPELTMKDEAAAAPAAPEPADEKPPVHATKMSELAVEPIESDKSQANSEAPAAAMAANAADETSSTGPARFEARPVGSTPQSRPVKKEVEPEDIRQAPFEFVGRGGEYFGIWIVNILLTIVTLGIYSAWATVRNNQYFYGNTRLDDASFQYLANPVTILKGRLLAVGIFILYSVLTELYQPLAIILGIGFLFAVPWIVIRSLRFRAINSAYRNVRFDFQASYADALMVMVVWPVLNVLTILLLTPFSVLKSHKFIAHGMRYGTTPFKLHNTNSEYYAFFGKGLLIAIAFAVGAFISAKMFGQVMFTLVLMAGYITVFGYFMAGLSNIFMNGATLKGHGFESDLQPGQMIWIYISNGILVALTLGLFVPWAKVRMARYRASCTTMVIEGDLDGFIAAENRRTSAIGQELGDAFDVGIAAF